MESTIKEDRLQEILIEYYKINEIAGLCRAVDQNIKAYGGNKHFDREMLTLDISKEQLVGELIDYCKRRGWYGYLVSAVRTTRPGMI